MIAAPWFGEFGWECSLWVPWLRWQCRHHYVGHDFTVLCKPGHDYLYADFATKIINHEAPKGLKVDCQHCWVDGTRLRASDYLVMVAVKLERRVGKREVINPLDLNVTWKPDSPPYLHQFVYHRYGTETDSLIGTTFHARMCQTRSHHRNWPHHKWEALAEVIGGHIASVGHPDEAMHIAGTEDLRGIPLRELCDVFAASNAVVGPSSGPLALAMLCGAPVVWWSGNDKDVSRFEKHWNPFKAPQVRAAGFWDPDVIEVEAACGRG